MLKTTVISCISISAFVSLFFILVGIKSSSVGIKMCAITAEIKKYKSIINEKKKKHDTIVLLAKSKLNSIEVLISYISHNEFVLVSNVLREYFEMKD